MDTVALLFQILSDRELSLYQLSQEAQICPSTLFSTIKRGGQLSVDTISRICLALDLRPYEFFMSDSDWQELDDYCRCRSVAYAEELVRSREIRPIQTAKEEPPQMRSILLHQT